MKQCCINVCNVYFNFLIIFHLTEVPLKMENSTETNADDSGCAADLTQKHPIEVGSVASLPAEITDAEKSSTGDDATPISAADDDAKEAAEDETEDGDAEEEEEEQRATTNEGDSKESIDPYGYLTRGDFSSEIYKVELMNLPKRFGIAVSG